MGFISIELALFITVFLGYNILRKTKVLPLSMVRNLTVYVQP